MNQSKRKPLLNRTETQTLLKSIKLASTAGAISLTLAGWGLLAHFDANSAQAASNQPVAIVASANAGSFAPPPKLQPTPAPTTTTRQVRKLDIVQWVQDIQGNAVAVVRDKRGSL